MSDFASQSTEAPKKPWVPPTLGNRKPPEPEKLISLNQLCRHLDISYAKALQFYRDGTIHADFTAERNFFFRPARLAELRKAVDAVLGTVQYFDKADNVMRRRPINPAKEGSKDKGAGETSPWRRREL
jgi:hypothetical protein